MSFLNPLTALLAAAVAVPLLLLLYVLKLRRRYMRIASTMLWQRSVEDLEVNTPFQRLRYTPLLLLQLLLLAALLLAMARPVAEGEAGASGRLILLLDRSASMNAADADGRTRLEEAKQTALDIIDRLGRGGGPREVMVIGFARSASVLSSFSFDRAALARAVNAVEPTDEQGDLAAALQLAGAFAGDSEEAGAQAGDVVLISDGAMDTPEAGYRLRAGGFRFVKVGPDADADVNNVGIVSLSARRDYDDPSRVTVFARLINAAEQAVETVLVLDIDGEPAEIQRATVPATEENAPGEAAVTFNIELQQEAMLTLQHNHDDALDADDVASLLMPAPAQPRIALVHPDDSQPDPFLHDLVEVLQPRELRVMSAAGFDDLDVSMLDAGELYDMIVFDRVSPRRLPSVPTLTFGAVPAGIEASPPQREGGRRLLSWDRQHPIMRHVSLDTVIFAGFGGYELPPAATPLAIGPDGPVIALLRTRGARHVVVGFDLSRSNWPVHVSIAVFFQNVLDYVTLAGSGQAGLVHQPGEPLTVRTAADAEQLVVSGPVDVTVPVQGGSTRTLPQLRRAGVYEVLGASPPMHRIAVSVLSDAESDIRGRSELIVNAEAALADRGPRIVPRELWPWVLGVALVLLVAEWLLYCRRASV